MMRSRMSATAGAAACSTSASHMISICSRRSAPTDPSFGSSLACCKRRKVADRFCLLLEQFRGVGEGLECAGMLPLLPLKQFDRQLRAALVRHAAMARHQRQHRAKRQTMRSSGWLREQPDRFRRHEDRSRDRGSRSRASIKARSAAPCSSRTRPGHAPWRQSSTWAYWSRCRPAPSPEGQATTRPA